ncbi:LysR substrate-binding domain-containing protein [Celerinatantimonas sp. MCCC 1A17872]|uniref:LysR substrate-binding domain-containing protein n=1 Tax=Celerinatantimonas sp. MCCC 1A17872 TaxID=3177514 RepID=UPI0038C9429E
MSKKLPPLQILQTFSVVAASNSFTAASKELHLSQSAVSRQIQQLEHYLGKNLFNRSSRKLTLTAHGEALLPQIEKAVASFKNSLESSLANDHQITVRMAPTLARRWFLPQLPELLEVLPELDVNVDTAWFLEPQFALGEVDVVISYGHGHWPGMQVVPLLKESITPVCSPRYPLLKQNLSQEEILRRAVLLHNNREHSDWSLWLEDQQLHQATTYKNQIFDTQDYALTAAECGYGIAMGDLALIKPELESNKLICPFEHTIETGYGYYAIFPTNSVNIPKVKTFINWITAEPVQKKHSAIAPIPKRASQTTWPAPGFLRRAVL